MQKPVFFIRFLHYIKSPPPFGEGLNFQPNHLYPAYRSAANFQPDHLYPAYQSAANFLRVYILTTTKKKVNRLLLISNYSFPIIKVCFYWNVIIIFINITQSNQPNIILCFKIVRIFFYVFIIKLLH